VPPVTPQGAPTGAAPTNTLAPTATAAPSPTALPSALPSAQPATPTRAPAAAQGRIVFVTERNGFNSIYVMNADGTNQRPLVPHKDNSYDYAPAVSPDARRLAFSSNREKPGTDNIYIINMDGSNLVKITDTPNVKNASSSWFPDGRRLAFTSTRDGRWQPYTMNDDGSNVRRLLTSNQDVLNVAVSPDGSKIAYICGSEICVMSPDGSNPRVLLQNGQRKDHLTWSPDSNLIGFTQLNPATGKSGVYVLDMQGNNRQVVANGGWSNWSPGGTQLVLSSDMPGVANLYLYNLDTGQLTRLTTTSAADYTPIWTR
jgi:Tol biopolymer transport system component